MNDTEKQTMTQIKTLFESQSYAVLSTFREDQPYASLVAFATTKLRDQLLFLTPRTTRKYESLTQNPKVALLITNHQNHPDDIYNAISVTATGSASTEAIPQKDQLLDLFIRRHPHLKAFSADPETALICVRIDTFFMVSQFQNVVKIKVPI